ncbi:hypothetical protein [Methylosinus sporium]|uniref:hypothetical protein n=1 Tax=Methylosinus sporium TaxID=428 RepID=UPI003839FEEC
MGVRSVVALEMEAASIGEVARSNGVAEWMVVKGVMDYADPNKDDRYKPFAARASAEVLVRFLEGRFEDDRRVAVTTGPAQRAGWRPRSPQGPFFDDIEAALDIHAPRFRGLFGLARDAANKAYRAAEEARGAAEEARSLLGDFVIKAHSGTFKKSSQVKVAEACGQGRTFIAKVWSSHDEYLGEGRGEIAGGKGVFKVYRISDSFTPDLKSEYAGHVEADRYGPCGVYTFPDRSQFAGEWSDGAPRFGYREYVGESDHPECDFFLGNMGKSGGYYHPLWFPQGQGLMVDAARRRVVCGEFRDGKPTSCSEPIEF